MRKLFVLALLLLVAAPVQAGENKHLGVMLMTGSSITNFTTAAPFVIPPARKITIVCSGAVQHLTDSTVVSVATLGTKGMPIAASTAFPTSVGASMGLIGGQPSGRLAMIGTAAVTCDVWARLGTE
jgi:hypothetical protein